MYVFDSAHNLVSKKCDPNKYKYITVIRDPVSRIKSFYEMQLENKKLAFHYHSKKGLEFFLSKLKINQNCMCKFIIGDLNVDINDDLFNKAKNNLKNFWFILKFETLKNDVDKLSKKLNIKNIIKHHGEKKNKFVDLSEKDKNIIIKFNEYDIKLYDFYKNSLEIN